MGWYTKDKCPLCKNTISGWHRTGYSIGDPIGPAFKKCPACNADILSGEKECIMVGNWPIHIFRNIVTGLIESFGLGIIIAVLILLISPQADFIGIWIFCSIAIALFLLFVSIKNIKESKERTKNYEYREKLYKYKLISKETLNTNKYTKMEPTVKKTNSEKMNELKDKGYL